VVGGPFHRGHSFRCNALLPIAVPCAWGGGGGGHRVHVGLLRMQKCNHVASAAIMQHTRSDAPSGNGRPPLSRYMRPPPGAGTQRFSFHCPGQKTTFWAVKRPAHLHKSAIQNRFTVGNAKAASTPSRGPDSGALDPRARLGGGRDLGSARSECEGGPYRASIVFPYRKFAS
jgi:hypothetical protein